MGRLEEILTRGGELAGALGRAVAGLPKTRDTRCRGRVSLVPQMSARTATSHGPEVARGEWGIVRRRRRRHKEPARAQEERRDISVQSSAVAVFGRSHHIAIALPRTTKCQTMSAVCVDPQISEIRQWTAPGGSGGLDLVSNVRWQPSVCAVMWPPQCSPWLVLWHGLIIH
jgi:hypothetical protein